MKLEVDGEERDLDEEKLERLVRHEQEVEAGEKEVTEPTDVSLFSGLKRIVCQAVPGSLPPRKTAVITDVDIVPHDYAADSVMISLKYNGDVGGMQMKTTDERYANMLGYLGYEHSEVLELPGEEVPISLDDRGRARIDVPDNTAMWAMLYFQFLRGLVRFGVLESNRVSKYTTRYKFSKESIAAILMGQFGFVLLWTGVPEFHPEISIGFFEFLALSLSLILAFMAFLWVFAKSVSWMVDSVHTELKWPV